MPHDYFHKKIWLTFCPPPPGSRLCLWAKYLLPCCCKRRQLLFDMQHDHILKKFYFGLSPTPKSTPGETKIKLKSCLICFISIAALQASKLSAKSIDSCLSYFEILIVNICPLRWGQRGWGRPLPLPCLSTGTGQSLSINIIALMKCEDYHTKS